MKRNARQEQALESLSREEHRRIAAGLAFPFIQQAMQGYVPPEPEPPANAGPTIAG
jgi:hypothetical protein